MREERGACDKRRTAEETLPSHPAHRQGTALLDSDGSSPYAMPELGKPPSTRQESLNHSPWGRGSSSQRGKFVSCGLAGVGIIMPKSEDSPVPAVQGLCNALLGQDSQHSR